MLLTLSFGGAHALVQDAQDAYRYVHTEMNMLSNGVTNDLVNLHGSLAGSNADS
jgi:hypothetical protein